MPNPARPAPGMIALWHARLQCDGWRRLADPLSEGERSRAATFFFERDARRFIVSHAVLRSLLGRATGTPARELKFKVEPAGKPVLEAPSDWQIHFSLARSDELVLIGLAQHPLGVDLEWSGRTFDVAAVAAEVLSPREQQALDQLCPADRTKSFLRCWTQKEAYLKAIGTGLQVAPSDVEVSFTPGKRAGLESVAGDARAAARWFVDVAMAREGYIWAVAIPGVGWRVARSPFDTSSLLRNA